MTAKTGFLMTCLIPRYGNRCQSFSPYSQIKGLKSDHFGEVSVGSLDEVVHAEAQHDVVSAAAGVDPFQIQDAAIDEGGNGLPMGEGRGAADGKLGEQQPYAFFLCFARPAEAAWRLVMTRCDFPTLALRLPGMGWIKKRRAALTEAESGKYSRTSGSKTTAPALGFTSLVTVVPSAL